MTTLDHSSPPSKGHVIFDYDLTLLPEESPLEIMKIAIAGRKNKERIIRHLENPPGKADSFMSKLIYFARIVWLIPRITRSHVNEYVRQRTPRLHPDLKRLLEQLRADGIRTHVISSAYQEWVVPVCSAWGFRNDDIAANKLIWLGHRAIFIGSLALHGRSGKIAVIRQWKARGKLEGTTIMVGDGIADRMTYTERVVDGFILAGYFSTGNGTLPDGNAQCAFEPAALHQQIRAMLKKEARGSS
ncbi:HAD family hydrolase [Castellaniella sp. WN]